MKQNSLMILVGDTLQLQKVGAESDERYASTVIGFVPGKSLLVTTPEVNRKPVLVRDGQQFAVRMVQGSFIQAFVTKVIHNALAPYPYIHLSFPQEVEYIEIRNASRVDTSIPILAKGVSQPDEQGSWKQATIKNISSTGARIESMSKIASKGEDLDLRFKLHVCNKEENLEFKTKIMHLEEPSNVGADEWGVFVMGTAYQKPGRLEQVLIENYVLEHRIRYEI